jgi:hypothetical protein
MPAGGTHASPSASTRVPSCATQQNELRLGQ